MNVATAVILSCLAATEDSREVQLVRTWKAICWKESKGDPHAVNAKEHAVGIAQIRPIYVRDANRILGRQEFTLDDRTDPAKSLAMFRVVVLHYAPKGGPREWARIHNGGGSGLRKQSTVAYAEDVLRIMAEQAK